MGLYFILHFIGKIDRADYDLVKIERSAFCTYSIGDVAIAGTVEFRVFVEYYRYVQTQEN